MQNQNTAAEREIQAITDAICALTLALGKQLNAKTLAQDLKALADEAHRAGEGASAGLIDVMVEALEKRTGQGLQ